MNEEVKEILEEFLKEKGAYSLRYSFNGDLAYSQEQMLKDYITNLQKEIERLKEENSNLIAKNKRKLSKYVNFPMSRFRGTDCIKEKIKCPQLGSIHYGEWGGLPLEVRYTIYDLCELIDSRDNDLKSLYRNLEIIDGIQDENVVKMQIRNLLYNYKELKGSDK